MLVIKSKSMCLVHYETKQTEMLEFRAEKVYCEDQAGVTQKPGFTPGEWALNQKTQPEPKRERESDLLLGKLWGCLSQTVSLQQ